MLNRSDSTLETALMNHVMALQIPEAANALLQIVRSVKNGNDRARLFAVYARAAMKSVHAQPRPDVWVLLARPFRTLHPFLYSCGLPHTPARSTFYLKHDGMALARLVELLVAMPEIELSHVSWCRGASCKPLW